MNITLYLGSRRLSGHQPDPKARYIEADAACPHCACEPVRTYSREKIEHFDRVEGEARCKDCDQPIGRIIVEFDTIFGLDEDRLVLEGRPRVYGGGPRE